MSSRLILLTGATSFVGAQILNELVNANHRVIVVLRSASLSKIPFIKQKYSNRPGAVQFAEVADQTNAASYLPHLKGVEAIIHTAAIIPKLIKPEQDAEKEVLEPMVAMVTALFEAALQVDTIKRFVVTSSSVTVYGKVDYSKKEYTEEDWNDVTVKDVLAEFNPGVIYAASKVFGERRLFELTKEKKPAFDVVTLCIPMVLGKSHHEVTGLGNVGGSASFVVLALIDKKEVPPNGFPHFVNATDSAKAHVAAATVPLPRTPDTPHRYLVSNGTFSFHRAIQLLLKCHPELEGRLPKADPAKYDEYIPGFRTDKTKRELRVHLDTGLEQTFVNELYADIAKYL